MLNINTKRTNNKANQNGIIIIWFTLLLPLLLLMLVYVIDFSWLYNVKVELQNVADAGAHAGALELGRGKTAAHKIAYQQITKHEIIGVKLTNTNIKINVGYWDPKQKEFYPHSSSASNAVKIDLSFDPPTFFGRLFAKHNYNLNVTSTAYKKKIKNRKIVFVS